MNKIAFLSALVSALLFAPISILAQNPLPKELKTFRNNLQKSLLWQAEIAFTTFDSFTQEEASDLGHLTLGIDAYKMELGQQVFLVRDSTSQVWDKAKKRILLSQYNPSEDDTSPARFLFAVDSVYQWQREKQADNKTRISLYTEDPFEMYRRVELLFEGETPERIKAYDQADNSIEIRFSSAKFLKYSESLLRIDHPKEIEVVDLRQ